MPADLRSLLSLEVPVIVQIARRDMHVDEVINLAPGAIIELPKFADEPLDILVNNKQVGLGSAVKVGENFGIRVTRIGAVADRIRAMGEQANPDPADEIEAVAPANDAAA